MGWDIFFRVVKVWIPCALGVTLIVFAYLMAREKRLREEGRERDRVRAIVIEEMKPGLYGGKQK